MNRSVWPRISAVLALLLFLAPALFAAPQQVKRARPERGIVAWFTQALDRFLPANLKSSGTMDPDGKPLPVSSTSDSSGTMDPDGRN